MNYHTSFARVCTITTLLSCLIVPRLVYAGWPMVKYKNGTVGILNDDGDVHVQNTNLFVYGKKVVHPEKCVPPGGRRQYFNGTEWMCVCEDGWSGLTCEIEKTLSMYFHEDVMQEGDTWVPCTNHQHEVSNGGYLWVSSELCARITSVLNEKVNSASMSSAGYSYTCGGQGGKYEDHANHFGYGDGTPGNGNTNVHIGSQLLEEASGVAFNDGNCCGIFGMENCHINATLVPKFEAFIASLFLLGKKVTPIPDASWHAYVAECLAEAPVTGECKKWASGNNYGTMPNWDVSQVVNMGGNKCTDADGDGNLDCILVGFVNTAFNGNVSRWDTSSVYYMHDMFRDAYAFNQPIGGWNLSNVNQIQNMFNGASAFNQPLHGWDVSNVYSMNGLFYGAASFNHPIESWNVSGVTEMEEMFEDAQSFNQPLGLWDVSSVTTMKDMFEGAISFNSPIDSASSSYYGWETSQVTSMEDMFKGALLFNQYIGALNVSRVQSMESMFEDAHTFDQPIRDWDVASVTSMEDMFQRAYSFNRPIGNWNTSSVTNMDQMFDDASTFEQDVSQWKGPAATSVATDRNMFYGATAFLAEFSCSVHGPASACLRKDTGPPKCVAPGGDKLQHNGTNWICVCVENWSGETCESPPSTSVTPIPIWSAPTGCYNSAENLGRSKCNDASCPDVAWEENSLTSWHESMSLCASVSSVSTSSFRTDGPICGIGGKVDARSHKGNTMSITAIYACDGSGNGFDVPNPSTGTLLQGETNLYEWGCETSASDPWIEVDYTRTTHDKLGGLIFRTQAGISCKIGAHKDNTAGVRELGHCGECAIYSMQLVTIPLGTGLTGVTMFDGGVYGLYFHFSTSPSPSP